MLIEAYFIFIQQNFYISTWAHNCLIYMHTHTFIYSHNSQWAQSILPFPYCTTLIKCVCIRSYNKPFTKPQARLTNFLALTEIVSHSNWLIFPCVIKPGYLPEQPRSHGPDDRSSTCCFSLWTVSSLLCGWAGDDQIRISPFRTWVKRAENTRKKRRDRGIP